MGKEWVRLFAHATVAEVFAFTQTGNENRE